MIETLAIRLAGQEMTEAEWLLVDASGTPGEVQRTALKEIIEVAGPRRAALVAPSTEVLLTDVRLPIRNVSRLLQAVPYALEEHLAEDVDDLHFAVGTRGADGRTPVAVVRRDRLKAWLTALGEAGIEPSSVVAEHDGVPELSNSMVWLVDGGQWFVREPGGLPWSVESDDASEVLELCGREQEQDAKPGAEPVAEGGDAPAEDGGDTIDASRHLTVYLTPDDHERYGASIEALRDQLTSLDVQVMPDGALPHLAAHLARQTPINLLQGEFAPRTSLEKLWKPWRVAASLILASVLVGLGSQAVRLGELRAEEERLDAAIAEACRKVMPGVRNVTRRSCMNMVDRMSGSTGDVADGGFSLLRALETLGTVMPTVRGAQIDTLSFRNEVLDIKLTVPSVDTLDTIRQRVADGGEFGADIQSATSRGDAVEGRIKITVAGA